MNKSVKTNVAIFLAATMVAGIIAVISPSFIDVEASGEKRDYKHNDNRHAKSNGVNVKFICNQNNIDVGGIDLQPRDIVSTLTKAQAQGEEGNQELSATSMQNGERNHGERGQEFKQHDSKDIIFICNNNNGGGNVPPVVVEDCLDCFVTTNNGGFLPPGQLTNILEELDSIIPGADLQDLCDLIESGGVSEEELLDFLNDALPGSQQRLVGLLFDCLSQFFPEEKPITTTP